jgi:hypothetical protein
MMASRGGTGAFVGGTGHFAEAKNLEKNARDAGLYMSNCCSAPIPHNTSETELEEITLTGYLS